MRGGEKWRHTTRCSVQPKMADITGSYPARHCKHNASAGAQGPVLILAPLRPTRSLVRCSLKGSLSRFLFGDCLWICTHLLWTMERKMSPTKTKTAHNTHTERWRNKENVSTPNSSCRFLTLVSPLYHAQCCAIQQPETRPDSPAIWGWDDVKISLLRKRRHSFLTSRIQCFILIY